MSTFIFTQNLIATDHRLWRMPYIPQRKIDRCRGNDCLIGFPVSHHKANSQCLNRVEHRVVHCDKCVKVKVAMDMDRLANVVGIAGRIDQLMKPDKSLGHHQWNGSACQWHRQQSRHFLNIAHALLTSTLKNIWVGTPARRK